MRYITVFDSSEGDILARDVVNNHGATLAVANTAINKYIKCKFTDIGVKGIWVHESVGNDNYYTNEDLFIMSKKNYIKSIHETRDIIRNLAMGKGLDINKLNNISDSVCDEFNRVNHCMRCINEMQYADEYTYTHSMNVAFYAMLIGKWMRLPKPKVRELVQAGLLHDIGKTMIAYEILNKTGRLNDDEFEIIKKHTFYGYDLVRDLDILSEDVKYAVLFHHEREDCSGYPLSVSGKDISCVSKIIAVTDVFDAMISDRVYKKGVTPFDAFEMFQTVGIGAFDIRITQLFLSNLAAYYVGYKALLNTGESGEIVYIPPENIAKPIIRIGSIYIDLAKENKIKILKIFSDNC